MTQTMLCSGHPNLASPPPPISLIDLIQRTPTGVRRLPSTPTVLCSLLQDVCRLQSIVCVDRPRASSTRIMPRIVGSSSLHGLLFFVASPSSSVDRPGLIVFRAIVCSPQISAELALSLIIENMNCCCGNHHHYYQSCSRSSSRAASHQSSRTYKSASATSYPLLCRNCDICPICSVPQTETPVFAAAPAPAPVDANDGHLLPRLSPQFLFTLFLLQAHLSGNWLYVLAFIVALVTSAM
ncbi:hypothetical protein R3P38DRAFT_2771171 [Favolaschia claudopus]|uniref:Uncharacterized protein n=1 Tax=Favolaschia claudopus TaxID=2862362 RepID=A0AAW0CCS7_9AGAR